MKHLNSYKIFESESKEYGVLYIRTCFPKGHKHEWLNYCEISGPIDTAYPKMMSELMSLISTINKKYKDVIYLPIDPNIHPGCCSEPESIENIATELYNGFDSIFNKAFGGNYIKLAWSIIELDNISDVDSLHHVGYGRTSNLDIIKFGRTSNKIKEPGIYKLDRESLSFKK